MSPRTIASLLLAVGVVAVWPATAAAQQLDGRTLAASLKRSYTKEFDLKVTSSRCPARLTARKGSKVTCQLTFASGDRTSVRVTFRDGRGTYTSKLRFFLMRHFEDELEELLLEEGVMATVRCPKQRREIRKGDRFVCRVTTDGAAEIIYDIIQDGDGTAGFTPRDAAPM